MKMEPLVSRSVYHGVYAALAEVQVVVGRGFFPLLALLTGSKAAPTTLDQAAHLRTSYW